MPGTILEKGERTFGKKNLMELYAVFTSPVLYRVQTASHREIGSLEQGFVDQLAPEMSSFLLGGRAWTVEHINHAERTLRVREAPRGKKPRWGGLIPQLLGHELCQKVRHVLTSTDDFPYLDATSCAALAEQREEMGDLLRRPGNAIQAEDGAAHWWTFAGGRINYTLKHALEWIGGWKVIADSFEVRIEGDGIGHDSVEAAIRRMATPGFWEDPETRVAILARLSSSRAAAERSARVSRLVISRAVVG